MLIKTLLLQLFIMMLWFKAIPYKQYIIEA